MNNHLTLTSLNVQGLGRDIIGVRKRREIRDFFQKSQPKPEIILVQEHKLSLEEGKRHTKQIEFARGVSLWNEATYCADKDSFKGGTGILLPEKIASLICEHGVIMKGRVQYVTLQWTPFLIIGIINIYAFNCTGSRSRLWTKIRHYPLPEAHWILGGDFNMIDQLDDKQGGQDTIGRGQREQVAWGDLQVHLGLQDSFRADEFRKLSTKKFSWDNRRYAPGMICSRLDRFYLNHTLIQLGGQTSIWPSLTHVSDHAPVVLKIHQQHFRTQNPPAFNRHLLDDENEKTLLLAEWTRAMALNSDKNWIRAYVCTYV
uniref:Endonuclease/exonuclease/phosphatase domain-containing protein n=1 Tax=Physcomitrium patens TaxID=3218 RepID=A0A2K1K5M5_PHYPA|nr:hypothetical protein PHYPA_010963 [Physcomitrium patens]